MEEEKKFPCVLCGTNLESKELLQSHFRKHANKEIDAKGNPIRVKKDDTNEPDDTALPKSNKITCDVCSMQFDSVTHAIQHKFRKHPEISTKYYCAFCGMQFPIKFILDKHLRGTHQGMSSYGSFPCSECSVNFHNTKALNYHFKSTHKRIMSIFKPVPTPPPSKKIKINNAHEAQSVYYCYLCGMEYIIKFNLQKHLERAHSEEERNKVPEDLLKCKTCDALFYNKKAYDNHNMYHRPDDLYVTSEEQRLQTVTRVDQDFDIRRVQLVTDKFIPVDKPKHRRQKIIVKKTTKKNQIEKPSTDDELSPTSSIDDSDSENETGSAKNKQERESIGKNFEMESFTKQNDVEDVTSLYNSLEESNELNVSNILEKEAQKDAKVVKPTKEIRVIVEKLNESELKMCFQNEGLSEKKENNKKSQKRKMRTFNSPATRRSLRSNTTIA